MSVVRTIEVMAESRDGWEEATKVAVKEAAKTVKNIKSVYVEDMQALVDGDEVISYRVNVKISFNVE